MANSEWWLCARNPFKPFGISFYAQISNDFYGQQMLCVVRISRLRNIRTILFYSAVAECARHVLDRSLAVWMRCQHPPYASHRWLCHFVTEPSVSFVVTPTIVPSHFVCVRVYGWLRIKSQSTPKQSKSLPEWENTRTQMKMGGRRSK